MPSADQQFAADLEAWGPQRTGPPPTLAAAEAYCRNLARRHYENFPLASWMLPHRLHQHFFNVYAYCRWADDLGDEVGDRERSSQLLAWWRDQLDACYGGSAVHPVFVALRTTIERFAIPREPFADLISAFEQDQHVREYETFAQLADYCRRSADPVGRIVLHLCECFNESNARLSDSICTGLQLANFWQDVARDYDIGRVYLPRQTRARFGYTDDDLCHRRTNDAFLAVMQFEVARARYYLLGGLPLVQILPGRLQIDIELFARGGLSILDHLEQIGYRVWERRPIISKGEFARLFAGTLGRTAWRLIGRRRTSSPSSVTGHDERPGTTDSAGRPLPSRTME
jgi:squalene synthase HpnC